MALKVWLPLNGSLENKGISGAKITSTAFTIENNGKIGKCIKTTTSSSIDLGYNGNQINTGDMSFGGWFKINEEDITSIINSGNYTSTNKAATSNLIGNDSYGGIGLIWSTNNIYNSTFSSMSIFATLRTSTVNQLTPSISVQFNQWMHLFVTFQKSTGILSFYKDGVLIGSKTFSDFSDAVSRNLMLNYKAVYGGNAVTFNLPYYVNDVRIYDHCLSQKEVKEISQGLVLHYKLNNSSITNYSEIGNLIPNYKEMGLGTANVATGTWRIAGSNNMTRTRVQITDSPVGECYCFQNSGIQTANDGSCYGIDSVTYCEPNTEYRISMFARITSGTEGYAGYNIYNISEELGGSYTNIDKNYRVTPLNSDGTWTYCWYHFKTNSSATRNIYIGITTGETSVTTQMCLVRIDKWNDGMDNSIIKDNSGYENNGIMTSVPLTQNDTPRYQNSTKLSKKKINCSSCFVTTEDPAFTISFWFKLYSDIVYTSYADLLSLSTNSYSSQPFRLEICGSPVGQNIMWFRGPSGNSGGFTVGSTTSGWYTLDQWHHTALVSAGNKQYICYFDGVQTNTFNGSSYSWTPTGNLSIGDTSEGTASFSDFRIYTTALSAEDILDLYHTPANIDNLGNIHGFEFEEKQGNMLAVSPLAGSLTWDSENNYYIITSQPSTSNWGIGPSVGVTPKKIIPWGYSYRLSYEVYSPIAATWYIDYNNNTVDVTLSGNDNDTGRIVTGVAVPANQWTLITLGCSNTNNTKNPDHLPLYDYSSGLGPVMTNISSPITWYMRNPQWYLVDTDESTNFQVYENGIFKTNFLKEDNLNDFASFRNNEKATWGINFIEK